MGALAFAGLAGLGAVGGWRIVTRSIYRPFDPKSGLACAAFAGTFALACLLPVLVLMEILGLMEAARPFLWRATLDLLVLDLLVVLPWGHAFCALRDSPLCGFRGPLVPAAGATALVLALVDVGWIFGGKLPGVPPREDHASLLTEWFTRLAMVGVVVSAVLGGYGCVNLPVSFLTGFIRKTSPEEIASVKGRLVQCRVMIAHKKRILASRTGREGGEGGRRGVWGGLAGLFGGSQASAELSLLRMEVSTLEALSVQLYLDAADLQGALARQSTAVTLWGRTRNALGHLFSVCCGFQILNTAKSFFMRTSGGGNPAGIVISIALMVLSGGRIATDTDAISQLATLIFIGIITANSLRAFIKNTLKFIFKVSSGGSTSRTMVFFLAEIMGLHFCASLLMLRQKLPEKHRASISAVFDGNVEFKVVHTYNDCIFLISAAITSMAFYVREQNRKADYGEREFGKSL